MAVAPDTSALVEHEDYLESKLGSQRSSTLIQIGGGLAAVVCLAGAAWLQNPINTQRKELQLTLQSNIYQELPPEYAWVSAAGTAFRGIAADILWMRAEKLKEEGKYFELHQLSKWICTLQPRFGQVWQFQAWNMSYNISVATHTGAERWQWVYNGIRLLRDEGIPNNERNLLLYQYLAWIWFHKVGDRMDDFHMSYKRVWAATMEILLGTPPAGVPAKEAIDWFRPVAQAPRSLSEVEKAHPGVAALVARLKDLGIDVNVGTNNQRIYHPLEENFFRPYTRYLQAQSFAVLRTSPLQQEGPEGRLSAFFAAAPGEDLDALLAWMRAKVLREQYKMDPAFMLELTGRVGTKDPLPIDWRTPWSQTLYWATLGSDISGKLKTFKEFETLQIDRNLLFAIKTMAKQGRYICRPNVDQPMNSFLNMLPDLRWIEAMHRKYIELGPKYKEEGEEIGITSGETFRSAHVNELHEAVVNLFLAGHVDEARQYLDYLAKNYKDQFTKKVQEYYLKDVESFVMSELKEMADTFQTANGMIYMLMQRGFMALASGYADEYAAAVRNASLIYETYQKDKEKDPEGRRALPEFAQLQADALADFVLNTAWPVAVRSGVWNRVPSPEVKRPIYDLVLPDLKRQCEDPRIGFDVDKAFPAPVGMDEWRAAHPNMEGVGAFKGAQEESHKK